MGIRLFVGNLSFAATEESLRERFTGEDREVVAVRIMIDRETGRPRGFAFVDMADAAQAQAAIDALDGSDFDGRALRVSLAAERPERGPSRSGGGERSGPPRERSERRPIGDGERAPSRGPSEFRGPPRAPGGGSGGGTGGGGARRFDNDRAPGRRDRDAGGRGGRDQGRRPGRREEGVRDEGRRSRRPPDDDDDDWE